MTGGNRLLQVARITMFAQAGVPDQFAIPDAMKVTRIVATLSRAKDGDGNVIASARVCHGVDQLAKIADKMDQKPERLAPSRERLLRITQDPGKPIDLRDHAVVIRAILRFVPG